MEGPTLGKREERQKGRGTPSNLRICSRMRVRPGRLRHPRASFAPPLFDSSWPLFSMYVRFREDRRKAGVEPRDVALWGRGGRAADHAAISGLHGSLAAET